MTNLKFKPVRKDRLFYDRFEYCVGFNLDEVNCLRVLDHAYIDDMIERRKQWREIAQQRWVAGRQKHGIIMSRRWKEITEKTSQDLHSLATVLLSTTADFKLVVTINQAYVYSNDLHLIDELADMPELTYKTFTQAQICRPKNTIQLKNAQHAYRSYFKMVNLNAEQKDSLMFFLHNQRDLVRVSPALSRWFDQSFTRTQDYFFVDYSAPSWITMMALVQPGIIRKTLHIIPAK